MKNLFGILITISIVIALFYSCKFLRKLEERKLEHFSSVDGLVDSPVNELKVKKTLNFKQVYSNKKNKYSIWEPVAIEDYFPVGHYITYEKNYDKPPTNPALLIKSLENESDKPISYSLISKTEDNTGIWQPKSSEGHVTVGHVFSKSYPSKHIIRCPSSDHLVPCNLKGMCVESRDYAIWNTQKNGSLILVQDKNNHSVPLDKPMTITLNSVGSLEPLKLKTTRKYKRLFDKKNSKLNQSVTFWRPIPPEDYISLGDIVTENKFNPNNHIQSFVIHKDFVKFPLNFGEKLISLSNPIKNATIWKPTAPDGCVSLGLVIESGRDEPKSNRIIGCIPMEYLIEKNSKELKMIYNNVPSKNLFSIHREPDTHMFKVNSGLEQPSDPIFTINKNLLYLDKDCKDFPRDVTLSYEINIENTLNYNNIEREEFLIESLSRKLEVAPNRFKNIKFDVNNRKIHLTVDSRPSNSDEATVGDTILLLKKYVTDGNMRIYSKDYQNVISSILYVTVSKPKNRKIVLDNSEYTRIKR